MTTRTRRPRGWFLPPGLAALLPLVSTLILSDAVAVTATESSVLTVTFPGLSAVHTEVRTADGVDGSATGRYVKSANWKTDGTEIELPSGIYDLILRKGAELLIIDDVDCRASSCQAGIDPATLTVTFPGLSAVHTAVL